VAGGANILSMTAHRRRRMRLCIQGTVQGVGFRPHVYGLATQLGLSGFVFNDDKGIVIEVEGCTATFRPSRPRFTTTRPCSRASMPFRS